MVVVVVLVVLVVVVLVVVVLVVVVLVGVVLVGVVLVVVVTVGVILSLFFYYLQLSATCLQSSCSIQQPTQQPMDQTPRI